MADELVGFKNGQPVYKNTISLPNNPQDITAPTSQKQELTGFKNGAPVYNVSPDVSQYSQQTPVSPEAHAFAVERATNPIANVSRKLGNAAPVLGAIGGGAAGEFIAGPPGAFAGETMGAGLGEGLRQVATGEMDPNAISREMLVNALTGPLFRGGSQLVGETVEHGIKSALIRNLSGRNLPQGIVDETGTATAGQMSPGNKMLSWIEDLFAPLRKGKILENQQTDLTNRFGQQVSNFVPDVNPEVIATSARTNLVQGLGKVQAAENAAFNTLKSIGKLNAVSNSAGEMIEGPINASRASKIVVDHLQELAKQARMSPYQYIQDLQAKGEPMAGIFNDVWNSVKKAPDQVTPLPYTSGGKVVGYQTEPVSVEEAIKIKSLAGNAANYGERLRTFSQTQLGAFNRAMKEDIDESIVSGWNNGKGAAQKAFQEANTHTTTKYKLYGDEKAPGTSALLSTADTSGEAISGGERELNALLKDPVYLRKALAGAGDPEALRKDLAGQQLSNLFEEFKKTGVGGKYKNLMEYWKKPSNMSVINDLYTPAERANIEKFFSTVKTLDVKQSMAGKWALGLRAGGDALLVLPTAMDLYEGREVSTGHLAALGALGIIVGINQLTHHVLMDPIAAKAASIAAQYPINSAEGRLASKLTMFALRGQQIKLKMKDGSEKPAQIDGQGRLVTQ